MTFRLNDFSQHKSRIESFNQKKKELAANTKQISSKFQLNDLLIENRSHMETSVEADGSTSSIYFPHPRLQSRIELRKANEIQLKSVVHHFDN